MEQFDLRYSVHNYFPVSDTGLVLNLASSNEEIRAATIDVGRRAIDIAADVGARFYGIHSGFMADVDARSLGTPLTYDSLDRREDAIARMLRSADELCSYGYSKSVSVYFENHVLAPFNVLPDGTHPLLLVDADEIDDFFTELDHPYTGLLLDVGHLNVSAATLHFDRNDFVDQVGHRIKALHLSGNDGSRDETLPFDNEAWFAPLVKATEIDCVIESNFASTDQAAEMVRVVENWRDTGEGSLA